MTAIELAIVRVARGLLAKGARRVLTPEELKLVASAAPLIDQADKAEAAASRTSGFVRSNEGAKAEVPAKGGAR